LETDIWMIHACAGAPLRSLLSALVPVLPFGLIVLYLGVGASSNDRGLMVIDIVSVKGEVNIHYQIKTEWNTNHNCCDGRRKSGNRSALLPAKVVRSQKLSGKILRLPSLRGGPRDEFHTLYTLSSLSSAFPASESGKERKYETESNVGFGLAAVLVILS
jgi:hypothetical protein